jgi:hypothetical protein
MLFRGFHGSYEITVTPPGGLAATAIVNLPAADQPAACVIQLDASGGVAVRPMESASVD